MNRTVMVLGVIASFLILCGCQKTIDIDIDKDFEYVPKGWPLGLAVGETPAYGLATVPLVKPLKEPPYISGRPLYGYMELGNTENRKFLFVINEGESGKPVMYFDANNNLDLTDDGPPLKNEGSSTVNLATTIFVKVPIKLASGQTIKRDYSIWFWINDIDGKLYPKFYARCYYRKELAIGLMRYTAIVFEMHNHDALYKESGIWIDIDKNGRLSEKTELFHDNDVVGIWPIRYKFRIVSP